MLNDNGRKLLAGPPPPCIVICLMLRGEHVLTFQLAWEFVVSKV